MDPARGCDFMNRYHVFSTEDVVHFRDEGEILRSDDVEWGRPEGGFMWAPPDCAFKNGRYWFYYDALRNDDNTDELLGRIDQLSQK